MSNKHKRFIPIFVIILGAIIYGVYTVFQSSILKNGLVVSGTIEAREINLGVVTGGTVDRMFVDEGDVVKTDQLLAIVKDLPGGASGSIRSPIDGIVLMRAAEPGEITTGGGSLLVVADLRTVTLTVFVPEDQYGRVYLGQDYVVSVDSFPGTTFIGTVSHIADQGEFTPRNAQSVQNRKNTVYAVKLTIQNPNFDLKPGMPADVTINFAK
jgi:multidrug efflux pump subunit AcrA (membrane-fusion protein)